MTSTTNHPAAGISEPDRMALQKLEGKLEELRGGVLELYKSTKDEDLEHADLGLQIVKHAFQEVLEGKGKGGHIEAISDARAHGLAGGFLVAVEKLEEEAKSLLKTHKDDEDLETAIKALEISKGSFQEVLERYVE